MHRPLAKRHERTTADQVAACSALDVHIVVENVVQGFVGQLHSDIRVRNLETSYRTLRDSSSRTMLAVPSDLVGGSLVQGKSEWEDKTFDTMEQFCCRELDRDIGVVGLHQPCGNTSLHDCMRITAAAATGGGGAAVVALIGRCSTTCGVFSLHFLIPLSLSHHFCP